MIADAILELLEALVGALSHITLEPDLSCRLHYGLSMASPARSGRSPPAITRVLALAL